MNAVICPVILAGGASARLWPLCGPRHPKWNLRLFGPRSLLQQTWDRARSLAPIARCLVVAGAEHAELIRRSLPDLPAENLLLEPEGRDTAGAIAYAAGVLMGREPHGVMLSLHSDHLMSAGEDVRRCVESALRAALREKALATIGVVPRGPCCQYGYIQRGEPLQGEGEAAAGAAPAAPPAFRVRAFKEKPDLKTAEEYIRSGEYSWNTGMFVFPLPVLLKELEAHLPEHAALVRALSAARGRAAREETLKRRPGWSGLPRISIDNGVLEKSHRVVTVPGSFAWDDIGSWSSVRDEMPRREGQACGPGVAVDAIEAQGNVVVGAGRVALIGVQDLAIVAGPEGLLVARLSQDQLVKQAVKKQPAAKRSDERVPSQDREIEAVFIVPPEVGPETGFLLVYHGFGESRLQHIATMERWAVRYNLVCIAPEYRDSGFDAYPSGKGARQPYDYSHLQLMDGLNAYRAARLACPQADGRRAFVWGGAQGGHLALLSAELAAGTFALCVALSNALGPSGSSFDAAGRAIRDPRAWAARLRCPVVLAHGTADPEVSVAITCGIARSLAEAGKDFSVRFVPGGDHRLGPACSWEELTEELADHLFRTAAREGPDDFEAQRRYEFPCPEGVVYRLEFAGGLACLRVVPPSQNSGGAR